MNFDDNIDGRSFLRRYGIVLCVAAVVVAGVVTVARQFSSSHVERPHHEEEITMVKLQAEPPPPPPPPPPPEIQEQKMIEQTPVDDNEPKPDNKPAPAPALGTGIKGDGPADAFGLSGSGNGYFGGTGNHGGGSRWGWYAAEVQATIQDALGKNSQTRYASYRINIRAWIDKTGRITRARLVSSTGDSGVDAAIKNNALTGLQLTDPPPAGMPMPIVMRVTELRPN